MWLTRGRPGAWEASQEGPERGQIMLHICLGGTFGPSWGAHLISARLCALKTSLRNLGTKSKLVPNRTPSSGSGSRRASP
eukprot:550598-Pyramimonas_sp.AAC.1